MKNRMALCNWSPIRTAPKNGRLVWLGSGDDMLLGFWGRTLEKGPRGGKPRKVKCWMVDSAINQQVPFEPTHWQHIPNPPGA